MLLIIVEKNIMRIIKLYRIKQNPVNYNFSYSAYFRKESSHLYNYYSNNPMRYTDPLGLSTEVTINSDGNYIVTGGSPDEDTNIYLIENGKRTGDVIGKTLTPYSFLDNNNKPVKGAVINVTYTSGQEFLDDFEKNTPFISYYMFNARNGKKYDFKDIGLDYSLTPSEKDIYRYRGMQIKNSDTNTIFASARDIGNFAAGYVSGRSGLLSWEMARFGFDLYQGSSEPQVTQRAEKLGYNFGKKQNLLDCQNVLNKIQSHH